MKHTIADFKKNVSFHVLLLVGFFIGFVIDIFFIIPTFDYGSDIRLFSLLLLWILLSKLSHFTSIATFKMALISFIVLFGFFVIAPVNPAIERVGSWVYMLLLIGIIQQFFELRKTKIATHS